MRAGPLGSAWPLVRWGQAKVPWSCGLALHCGAGRASAHAQPQENARGMPFQPAMPSAGQRDGPGRGPHSGCSCPGLQTLREGEGFNNSPSAYQSTPSLIFYTHVDDEDGRPHHHLCQVQSNSAQSMDPAKLLFLTRSSLALFS